MATLRPMHFALLRWPLQCVLTAKQRPLRARFASASYRSRLGRNLAMFGQRILAGAVVLFSSAVLACPACGAPDEKNQAAYLAMTVMMSLTPLAAIGAVVWWVARSMRGE